MIDFMAILNYFKPYDLGITDHQLKNLSHALADYLNSHEFKAYIQSLAGK